MPKHRGCLRREKPEGLSRSGLTRRPRSLFILRKEVIQPQVPLLLPCYDLAPITDPTLDAAPLTVGLTALDRTGSHGLTGGVYKAQEHIHRGMADPRLLAIPAS